MRTARGTYVHRGDAARRRARIRRVLIASGAVGATVLVLAARRTTTASAELATKPNTGTRSLFSFGAQRRLENELESARGELALAHAQVERSEAIIRYSARYAVTADVATSVFDASLREGLDPDLGFRLIRLESDFNARAVSHAGAVGLLQVMPQTARQLEKTVSREQLFNPATNLRVGFRYLRTLLDQYRGDIRLALLAYNRGEDAVSRDLRAGVNPGNGYDRFVLRDYSGTGFIQ